MNHGIYSSNGKFHTLDGKVFDTMDDAKAHSFAKRQEIEAKFGYFPDDSTWGRQGHTASTDSRTFEEKVADENWTPRKRTLLSPVDRQIQELEAAGAKQREGDEYKNLNRHEQLALDLRKMRDREESERKADAVKAAHLKANAAMLQAISEAIAEEQFNPESDQRFREQLRKLKLAYQEPDADPGERYELEAAVKNELLARHVNQEAGFLQEQAALDARKQNAKLHPLLDQEPDPAPEHEPDPNGFDDPMRSVEQPEAKPETPTVKVEVNRDQDPIGVAFDLRESMAASGSFTDDQISEVRQAALSGEGLESVINKYAV